jgi:hypothetical protein
MLYILVERGSTPKGFRNPLESRKETRTKGRPEKSLLKKTGCQRKLTIKVSFVSLFLKPLPFIEAWPINLE